MVHVSTQNWQRTCRQKLNHGNQEIMWWQESNSYKQIRPHRAAAQAFGSFFISPAFLLLFGLWKRGAKVLMVIFLPVLIRAALMSCTPCRDCQTFLCLFTEKPHFYRREGMWQSAFVSKKNTKAAVVPVLSVQVKSSVFSEGCSRRSSGPVNFYSNGPEERSKTCEREVQGCIECGKIHTPTSPRVMRHWLTMRTK